MALEPRFAELAPAIDDGNENLLKWYYKGDGESDAYLVCLGKFLDPSNHLVNSYHM